MNPNGRKPKTASFGKVTSAALVSCPRCNGTGKIYPETISIGDRFLFQRRKLDKTQQQLAPSLAVSRAQLANIEGNRGRPGLETLVKAADAFNCSIDYLLGRSP